MKEYHVESLIFYTKITLDKEHILKDSTKDIQAKLDEKPEKVGDSSPLMLPILASPYISICTSRKTDRLGC